MLAGCARSGLPEPADRSGEPIAIPLHVTPRDRDVVRRERAKGLAPVEAARGDDRATMAVALGRRIFVDVQMGVGVACTTCHKAERAGSGPPVSYGSERILDVPSLTNLRYYTRFGTGGGASSLAEFVSSHLVTLSSGQDPSVRDRAIDAASGGALRGLFPDGPGEAPRSIVGLAGKALGAYLESIVATSRFDSFLRGDERALSPQELEGFDAFFERGCVTCHDGAALGGRVVATLGLAIPWPGDAPLGEHAEWRPRRARRVASLRSAAVSAPYFNEGAIADLPTAVQLMATHQLGVTLPDRERDALVAFVRALSGTVPASLHGP